MYNLTCRLNGDEIFTRRNLSYKEACENLKMLYNEELKIQTDKNHHFKGEDLETYHSGNQLWDYASITIICKEDEDKIEWSVYQNSNNHTIEFIKSIIHKNDFTAKECEDIFRALTCQNKVLGGKIFTTDNIRSYVEEFYPEEITLSDDDLNSIASNIKTDKLDEPSVEEHNAIQEAVQKTNFIAHIYDIEWDLKDYDDEEKFPIEKDIPFNELNSENSIKEWLYHEYGRTIKSCNVSIIL